MSSRPGSSSSWATATSGPDEQELAGGVANAGVVFRAGDHVLRPATPLTPTIHALFRHVRARAGDIVPDPVGVDDDGRERLVFVPGDVPLPPYPAWAQTDEALASIARLLRRYHDAAAGFRASAPWSDELADPAGGDVVCHNDVCLENVVFRDGQAVALLDFEFAAPGRPVYDAAVMARMCVPADGDSSMFGWAPHDVPSRLRVVADSYGLDGAGRGELLACLDDQVATAGEFIARRVAAGEQAFVEMWERGGGKARFDRRRAWWATNRDRMATALA